MTSAIKRRCPRCELVASTSQFRPVHIGARSPILWPLKCVACGFTAPARLFRIEPVRR